MRVIISVKGTPTMDRYHMAEAIREVLTQLEGQTEKHIAGIINSPDGIPIGVFHSYKEENE